MIVNSFNEWDPLEEVIVGVVDGAAVPPWHAILQATMPQDQWDFFRQFGGQPFPQEWINAARQELNGFAHILEAEGVTVRRPDPINHARPYSTPDWTSASGVYAAMPRDVLLAIGNEIIEAPMAWRSRYFESHPYRSLIKDYFRQGAKWTAAPKPQLTDELYNHHGDCAQGGGIAYAITEFEPTFDAADFIRCGRDIIAQKSHVTNALGISWLQRHLGSDYQIHTLEFNDPHPMHIDATLMPLAPGKILVNPKRVLRTPDLFKTWDIFYAPPPDTPDDHVLCMSSQWISMNVLMLDEERVIVEKHQTSLIAALRRWGLKPIPCCFRHFNAFGGSFHCATLDVRRRGTLQSYF